MASIFLPFAEIISTRPKDGDDDGFVIIPVICDDQLFPPLEAATVFSNDWQVVERDYASHVDFVKAGQLSYAEAATQAGLQHKPIMLSRRSATQCTWLSPLKRQQEQQGSSSVVNDSYDDLWDTTKYMGNRKYETEQTILRRKRRTIRIKYRHETHELLHSTEHERLKSIRKELASAQRQLNEYQSLTDQLPPRSYNRNSLVTIKNEQGQIEQVKPNKGTLKIMQRQHMEELCKDPKTRRILHARFETIGSYYPDYLKRYLSGPQCTIAEYCAVVYRLNASPFNLDIYDLKENVISKLEEEYNTSRAKWIRALVNRLPSTKDKTLCVISPMQYALYTYQLLFDEIKLSN